MDYREIDLMKFDFFLCKYHYHYNLMSIVYLVMPENVGYRAFLNVEEYIRQDRILF